MAQKSSQSNRYGIDNLTYDLIAVIHEKAQGMEAFEQYLQDAQGDSEVRQCFHELQRQDRENIQRLQRLLQNRLGQMQEQRAA
jgi:ubiquinone biosynthesis protein Coq4